MLKLVMTALAAIVAGITYFLVVLLKKRRELDGLPCPPMKNRLLGHLDLAADCNTLFPPGTHGQAWIPYLQKKYNQGDCFYVDWWPIGPRWLFISNPELISQHVTTGRSLPKASLAKYYMTFVLGENNMVTLEGQRWKHLRRIFNPGFSAGHLMTLVPYIVDASMVFHDILCEKAKSKELFSLDEYAARLTIDIIGKVVLDSHFDSQKKVHPIVETFEKRLSLIPRAAVVDLTMFELRRRVKLWLNGRKLDRLTGEEIDRKFVSRNTDMHTTESMKDRDRSVLDLAMDAYIAEQDEDGIKQSQIPRILDNTFRTNAIDQLKTFIFAGHDTTSSTVAYAFYLLHLHRKVHQRIVDELKKVFSSDATTVSIADTIKDDPRIINKLEYTTAVIKETLRLFPPASTLREHPVEKDPSKNMYFTHPDTGQKLPLSGWSIWPTMTAVGRNEKFFPNPAEFIPERFIQSMTPFPESELFTPAGKDAWRPFEKGPRNCIGQELAMIEIKVILAPNVIDLDFTAEFDGVTCETHTPIEMYKEFADGKPGTERMTIEGHRAYQILKGTAKPRDGMPGRMSFRRP